MGYSTALTAMALERLICAARAAAEEIGVQVCIAATDSGGNLAAFLRMPNAFLVSSEIAIDKAWTAAGMKVSTRDLGQALRGMEESVREGLLRRPRFTDLPGGFPVLAGAVCIGGIGVSGGSAAQDEEIARQALEAVAPLLQDQPDS